MKDRYLKVREVLEYQKIEKGVSLFVNCDIYTGATIKIKFYSPGIVRVKFSLDNFSLKEENESVSVKKEPLQNLNLNIESGKQTLKLVSGDLRVEVDLDPWQIRFYDKNNNLLTKEVKEDQTTWNNQLNKPRGITAAGEGQNMLKKIKSTHTAFSLGPREKFYGFGEKFTPFVKNGQNITMWNQNAQGTRSEASYKNIPFFISSNNYGIFVDNTTKINFHMGDRSHRAYGVDVYDDNLDYYFIYGEEPYEILENYTDLTGHPPYPPEWSFGLWLSTYFVETNDNSVKKQTNMMRKKGIPCDVYHFDCHWLRDGMWNDFTWDRDAFPEPYDLIEELHDKGYKISVWENPYISVFSELYQEGKEKGYFLTRKDGSVYEAQTWRDDLMALTGIVDFTNPEAVEWYKDIHRDLIEKGIDVFKTDFGEDIPTDAYFHNGKTGKTMRNIYSLLYNKAVFEVTEEKTGNSLVWGRSGWAGSQRYPTHWGGDPHATWEDMASTLRGGLSLSMSGLAFWSHDIGGFKGEPSPELYIRWAQFGLLSPHARLHGWGNRDPWNFGEKITEIFKDFTRLRYKLLPYIFSYAKIAHEKGYPMMRPLLLEYPNDPSTYNLEHQYMLGKELLIAPVLSPDNIVEFYLPEGKWYDFWSGNRLQGGTFIRKNVELEKIPIYIPENSIVPLGPVMNYVYEKEFDPLTLNIYPGPGGAAEFELYNDIK